MHKLLENVVYKSIIGFNFSAFAAHSDIKSDLGDPLL